MISGRYSSALNSWSVASSCQRAVAVRQGSLWADWHWRRSAWCGPGRGRCRSCSSARGFSSTRTAGLAPPPTITCPTPSTCASFCARMESAASYICGDVDSCRTSAPGSGSAHRPDSLCDSVGLFGRFGGQLAARRVDGGLHVARGGIDIAAQIELQRDVGAAQAAG